MKAMILAAGRGERMRPLTDKIPKPLLRVGDKPLIAYHLLNFAKAGIRDIVINVSYLAEQIQNELGDGKQYGVHIQYSVEPQVLETGGGIVKALPLLGDEPFIVVSADIWTTFDYAQLKNKLTKLAHLIFVPNPNFHPQGDFGLENDLVSLNGDTKFTFANIGIYRPELFAGFKLDHFKLVDVLNAKIQRQQITGEIYKGAWYNIGTVKQLEELRVVVK